MHPEPLEYVIVVLCISLYIKEQNKLGHINF